MHLGREGTASRLELFFDLAYVLVVLELAKAFDQEPDLARRQRSWRGLFLAIWFSWVGFTLYANRFDTDDVGLPASPEAGLPPAVRSPAARPRASDAAGKLAVPFAACYLGSRAASASPLYVRAWRHVRAGPAHRSCVYLLTVGSQRRAVGECRWSCPDPARYLAVGDRRAGVRGRTGAGHLAVGRACPADTIEHLPERFALLVILVLGEAVGGAARGVHDASWAPISVAVGALAFASRRRHLVDLLRRHRGRAVPQQLRAACRSGRGGRAVERGRGRAPTAHAVS